MKHTIARTNVKKDESSIAIAPQPITPACFKMIGIAMLPTAEAPVKNLVTSAQLLPHCSWKPNKAKKIHINELE